jgi:hypothetical protein
MSTRGGALAIAPHAGRLADAEHMFGHGQTAYRRLEKYGAQTGSG